MIEEYLASHEVWPEMLAAIKAVGINNYSLFINEVGEVIGYFEADDPEKSLSAMGRTEVNARWQKTMAKYFESGSGDLKDGQPEKFKRNRSPFYAMSCG